MVQNENMSSGGKKCKINKPKSVQDFMFRISSHNSAFIEVTPRDGNKEKHL